MCAPENGVGAERFVELPLEFTDVAERIRFGIEGATDEGYVAEGDEVVCATKLFDETIDTVTRVRVGDFEPLGTYGLLTNSRADPELSAPSSTSRSNSARRDRKANPSARCSSSATLAR